MKKIKIRQTGSNTERDGCRGVGEPGRYGPLGLCQNSNLNTSSYIENLRKMHLELHTLKGDSYCLSRGELDIIFSSTSGMSPPPQFKSCIRPWRQMNIELRC